MKKLGIAIVTIVALFAVRATAGEWTGTISDAKCAAAHADASEKSMKCAQKCVKGGAAPVFVSGDTVYKFDADSKAKVMDHVGHKVTITGAMEGDTIKVESVKMM